VVFLRRRRDTSNVARRPPEMTEQKPVR